MRRLLTATVICAVGWSASACALRTGKRPATSIAANQEDAPADSLRTHIEKIRQLSARPAAKGGIPVNLEQQDGELGAALLQLSESPTAEGHRLVAERYRALGVADEAYEHFSRAVSMNRRDAAAHDGLARVWRDWGFPGLALGDSHRALYYAPSSAAAHNTLGTILQSLGQHAGARRAFEQASQLDSRAVYALSNLCYLSFLDGEFARAVTTCRSALTVDPGFRAARNNLALAHAAAGRLDLAFAEFLVGGEEALGFFNIGIVHLAMRDYPAAAKAFDAASRRDPAMAVARERAAQARQLGRIAARAVTGDPK